MVHKKHRSLWAAGMVVVGAGGGYAVPALKHQRGMS